MMRFTTSSSSHLGWLFRFNFIQNTSRDTLSRSPGSFLATYAYRAVVSSSHLFLSLCGSLRLRTYNNAHDHLYPAPSPSPRCFGLPSSRTPFFSDIPCLHYFPAHQGRNHNPKTYRLIDIITLARLDCEGNNVKVYPSFTYILVLVSLRSSRLL